MTNFRIGSYENIQHNYDVIKQFTKKYKDKLIKKQGEWLEELNSCKSEDYIKFMYSLSDEEYIGNQLTALLNNDAIEAFERIINGEIDIDEYLNSIFFGCR